MKYIDTYILAEIADGNKCCLAYVEEEFVITDLTLAEFYWILLRDKDKETADYWFERLKAYAVPAGLELLKNAMYFRRINKKKDLSFFDCVGYLFALERQMPFVTGDRQFEHMENVEYVK